MNPPNTQQIRVASQSYDAHPIHDHGSHSHPHTHSHPHPSKHSTTVCGVAATESTNQPSWPATNPAGVAGATYPTGAARRRRKHRRRAAGGSLFAAGPPATRTRTRTGAAPPEPGCAAADWSTAAGRWNVAAAGPGDSSAAATPTAGRSRQRGASGCSAEAWPAAVTARGRACAGCLAGAKWRLAGPFRRPAFCGRPARSVS